MTFKKGVLSELVCTEDKYSWPKMRNALMLYVYKYIQ